MKLLHGSDTRTPPSLVKLGEFTSSVDATRYAPDRSRSSSVWWLVLVGLAATLLCAPFFRMLFFWGDEGALLHEAELLLQGKKIYADFFQFLPPGSVILTAAWFSIAGISFGAARSLALLIIVGIACFTYLACRQASRSATISTILAIGWAMMSVWIWMQLSHHWFTTFFSMVAAWAALASVEQPELRLRWPVIAGAMAGAAVMCTPSSGALVILAAMPAFVRSRRNPAQLIAYLLGCALAPLVVLAYLLEQHTLFAAFDDIIGFTVTRYSSINKVPYGFQWSTINRPLKYIFPLAALLVVFVSTYDWRGCFRDRRLWLCTAFALAGFLGCLPRIDIWHLSYGVPLALPLLAFCMTRLSETWHPVYRYAAVAIMIGLCGPSAHRFQQSAQQTLHAEIAPTPRGDVALFGPFTTLRGVPELLARIAAAPSGDAYLVYPYDAMLPFLTAREYVSKYDVFMPGYTTPAQYREACRDAVRHASWVVVDRDWTDYNNLKARFPSMVDHELQEAIRFEQALEGAFDFVATDGVFESRRRREGVSDSVCDSVAEE